ncbi:hypothetical protein IAU60_000409 [Kwoniella sp. DSM 27419]
MIYPAVSTPPLWLTDSPRGVFTSSTTRTDYYKSQGLLRLYRHQFVVHLSAHHYLLGEEGPSNTQFERSQGSVSALVARFQNAADRDKDTKAREQRRVSGAGLQLPSGSSPLASRRSSHAAGSHIQSVSAGDADAVETSSKVAAGPAGDDGKEDRLEGSASESALTNEVAKGEGTEVGEEKIRIIPDSPVRPPKSPRRVGSRSSVSADNTDQQAVESHRTVDPNVKDDKQGDSSKKAASAPRSVEVTSGFEQPAKTTGTTKTPIGTAAAAVDTATTRSKAVPEREAVSQTNATRSRPVSASASSSTPKIAKSASKPSPSGPSSASSTMRTPDPINGQSSTPSTARTTRLTPSHTGPAPRRSSVASSTPSVPSPLKPHLTGTPSKPTASSLAKARSPNAFMSPPSGAGNKSAGRASLSLGKAAGKSTGHKRAQTTGTSPSPSPSPFTSKAPVMDRAQAGSDTPSKVRTPTGSRLLQGTAASRARAAAAQHRQPTSSDKSSSSPVRTANDQRKARTSSAKQGDVGSPRNGIATGSHHIKSRSSGSDPSTGARSEPAAKPGHAGQSAKTPSVGRNPIGRLGLAAARENDHASSERQGGGGEHARGPSVPNAEPEESILEKDADRPNHAIHSAAEAIRASPDAIVMPQPGAANGTDSPIQRPRTPSPVTDHQAEVSDHVLAKKQEEQQSSGVVIQSPDVPVGRDESVQPTQEASHEEITAGLEAVDLEEIPDIDDA